MSATAPAREAVIGDNSTTMDIVAMLKEDPKIVFRDPDTLPKLLAQLDKEIDEASTDVSTKAVQDEIRTRAFDIAKLKTKLEDTAKVLTEDFRKQTKEVNDVRNVITEELNARRDRARKPLTDLEDAQKLKDAKIKEVSTWLTEASRVPVDVTFEWIGALKRRLEALELPVETFGAYAETYDKRRHEIIGILDAAKAKLEQDDRDRAELARLRAANEAAEREKEIVAQRERDAQAARDREAQIAQQAADDAVAEERRKAQVEADRVEAAAAEERRVAADKLAQVEREAAQAREALAQQEREKEEAQRAEAARRADQAHREKVICAVVDSLMQHSRIGAVPANAIVQAIIAGSVPHVSLRF